MYRRRVKLAIIVVLAACAGSRTTPSEPPAESNVAPAPTPPSPSLPPLPAPLADAAFIQAPHGGAIATLAVTADGGAVVSGDELGGVRLWPVLDGSLEPRVVHLSGARALAIAREPRGFVIAMLDNVGGLTVQLVDSNGVTLQRVVHAAEPAFVGIEAAATGFIGWREDQAVVRIGSDGAVTERLATQPGERILSLAVRGERAFAVIQGANDRPRVRKLVVGPALAWGDKLSSKIVVGPTIAVSPNGQRIASIVTEANTQRLQAYAVVTGEELVSRPLPGAGALEFVTDDKLAAAVPGTVWWFTFDRTGRVAGDLDSARAVAAIDASIIKAGVGRAIIGAGNELMFAYPNNTEQYLGYDLETPGVAAFGAEGRLLVAAGTRFVVLDEALRTLTSPALGVPAGSAAIMLRWLEGETYLLEHMNTSDGRAELALADLGKQRAHSLKRLPMTHIAAYEPTTQLATLSHGPAAGVYRVDRSAKQMLTLVGAVPKGEDPGAVQLVPVAPSLAGGVKVVMITSERVSTIRWVEEPGTLGRGVTLVVEGSVAAVTRAGHVLTWESPAGPLELVIYRNGKRLTAIPNDGVSGVSAEPNGAAIALLGPSSIRVVGIDGKPRWSMTVQNLQELVWGQRGELALVTVNGVVTVDSTTGVPRAARCGWGFGVSPKPHAASARVESVCTQITR